MKGGVKFYRGGARGARNYIENERSRADDYYLAEGTGYAHRVEADDQGVVTDRGTLDADAYESWVAGVDPDTGELRGRIRHDAHAVRFAEVIVNGPKSWSLVAELHPDIALAYEHAQDQAAEQIVSWLGQHATVRTGRRGQQVATPVQSLDAVTVRHYTNRSGDPHRHLHLQVNTRVRANDKWYGLDTVAVRNAIPAMQGIGHAAVMADPSFRRALAAHGFSLDESGEVVQLKQFLGPFSRRAEQVGRAIDRYERQWRAANPDQEPGPGLFRSWDARAWSDERPDKGRPVPAVEARACWVEQLRELGFSDPAGPVPVGGVRAGRIDRDAAAAEVVARLGTARSAWSHPELRGEAEQLVARTGVVAEAANRTEMVEDIVARAAVLSVPILERAGVPDHIRALSSRRVIAVEADITGRLAVRGALAGTDVSTDIVEAVAAVARVELDTRQTAAVAALAGDHALVVVHGAAGAGKTTTLATARDLLAADGHDLVVVTPSLKAAKVAGRELGTHTGSAAKLVYAHGWRWNEQGWRRLTVGQTDPRTGNPWLGPHLDDQQLGRGDLLVVDEAGMLDQDTAQALLTLADETGARIALVGDPHQLPAVGRGGTLDMATRWSDSVVDLTVVHRFTRTVQIEPGIQATVEDTEYADLTLAMRHADQPARVFDQLAARGQVVVHASEQDRQAAIAQQAVADRQAGRHTALVVDTTEQAAQLNGEIRARLVAAGLVEDTHTATSDTGQALGAGDLIATRHNDRDTDVANRDQWTVTAVSPTGGLRVSGMAGQRELDPGYVREHVELAYATTAHGVQGETVTASHLLAGDTTSAAAAYVGMTRGRENNTVHLVARTDDEARQAWVDMFGRGRPDLGVEAARRAAERAAAQYAEPQPASPQQQAEQLRRLVDDLHQAWLTREISRLPLETLAWRLENAQRDAALREEAEQTLTPLRQRLEDARQAQASAAPAAKAARPVLEDRTTQIATGLQREWDQDTPTVREAQRIIREGPGRFGQRHRAVQRAQQGLDEWAERWRPVLSTDPDQPREPIRYAGTWSGYETVREPIWAHAADQARDQLPKQAKSVDDATDAQKEHGDASQDYHQAERSLAGAHAVSFWHYSPGWTGTAHHLDHLTEQVTQLRDRVDAAEQTIDRITRHPLIASHGDPEDVVQGLFTQWELQRAAEVSRPSITASHDRALPAHDHSHDIPNHSPHHDPGGPSMSM